MPKPPFVLKRVASKSKYKPANGSICLIEHERENGRKHGARRSEASYETW